MTRTRSKPLLDETWTRVEHFSPAGPSKESGAVDSMQVDGVDEEEESEWEYEDTEELVTLDLGPESKRLLQMSHQYSITGLETNQPYLRLGNVVFKGQWDQLIGTEIILRDQKESIAPFQHDVQPLPATQTDIRIGRAPSTTRHRIQFRPAVNMVAREKALREPGGGTYVPSITHKGGWVWIRGRGWIRKEQVNTFEDMQEDSAIADETRTADTTTSSRPATGPKKKLGRKKMTAEEKMRYSIWKSLQKAEKSKIEDDGEDDPNEEDGSESGDEEDNKAEDT